MTRNGPPSKPLERTGIILFLLALFFLGTGALIKGWYEFYLLGNQGMTTEGVVVDRDTTAKGDKQITYRFEVPGPDGGMQTYQNTRFVARGFFTLPGEAISVVYLPTHPETSNIVGNRFLLIGDRILATIILGLVEAFVGVLLVLHIVDALKIRHR